MAEIGPGNNSLEKAKITSAAGYTAEIYTHGAHVTSWKTPDGQEQLFVSELAIFDGQKAIRGGIPICWPQFSEMGPCKTQHGFARNTTFTIISSTTDKITMELRAEDSSTFSAANFPHAFSLVCEVTIGDGWLEQELRVQNLSETEVLRFTAALHTYFRLQNGIHTAAIRGLQGSRYLDSLQNRKECLEKAKEVYFDGECDRIYLNVPDKLEIIDGGRKSELGGEGATGGVVGGKRVVLLEKSNFSDVVVWNPYVEKAAKMADFGDGEWKDMVCAEVAQAGSGKVELLPLETWMGKQRLVLH